MRWKEYIVTQDHSQRRWTSANTEITRVLYAAITNSLEAMTKVFFFFFKPSKNKQTVTEPARRHLEGPFGWNAIHPPDAGIPFPSAKQQLR